MLHTERGPGPRAPQTGVSLGVGRERGRAWKEAGEEGDSRPRSTARCAAPGHRDLAHQHGPEGRLRRAQTNGAAVPAETWTHAVPKTTFKIRYKR